MTTLDDPRRIIDPSSVSIWPTALRYGGIMGAIGIVMALIMFVTGMTDPENQQSAGAMGLGCLSGIITIVMLVFTIKKHRDQDLGGAISLGRAIGVGTAAATISGIISAIWSIIQNNVIDPSGLERTREAMIDNAQPGQEELMESMANIFASPVFGPLAAILGSALIGLILSLIIGAIMKKDPAPNV
jgi:Na+/melibiose symporter-like transporter